MENNKIFKGLYMNAMLLEDRLRIAQNKGFTNKNLEESYDEIMFEDMDLHHIEFAPARSIIVQGYLHIPFNKKLTLTSIFKGKAKELKIWFNKEGNEQFEKLRELLMEKR